MAIQIIKHRFLTALESLTRRSSQFLCTFKNKNFYHIINDRRKNMIDLNKQLIPPKELLMDGSQSIDEYICVGSIYAKFFEKYLTILPNYRILEVGCCVGRISRQLILRLSEEGYFIGFDILAPQIEWCRDNITSQFNNFEFVYADIIINIIMKVVTMKQLNIVFQFMMQQ
jgi:SAM-dependent methyltransferase